MTTLATVTAAQRRYEREIAELDGKKAEALSRRDAVIARAYIESDGALSYADIGAAMGQDKSRVGQIVKAERARQAAGGARS